jgi:lysosomal alpha-mannosidase
MQNRTRNFRSYYNITQEMYDIVNQNITANYYPINSALAIKDSKSGNQLTVSNDRAQGGSSLVDGRIELMQNRRIPCDDGKGEQEFVNETDSLGAGIRVPATYRVQLHNLKSRPSLQRSVQ